MSENLLKEQVSYALDQAKKSGATGAEVVLVDSTGLDVSVRKGEVETLEFTRAHSLSATVYIDTKKATVGISDPSFENIDLAISRALEMAKMLESDPFEGLPDPADLGVHMKALSLDYPWMLTPTQAIAMGIELEQAALGQHATIQQCEGAHISTARNTRVFGNSLGFIHGESSTYHSIVCSLIAKQNGAMQRDSAYDVRRDPLDLKSLPVIAQEAAQNTVARLGARSIASTQCPILFDSELATGLISHFLSAISGGALYRDASFLCHALGKQVFSSHIQIEEDPFLPKAMGSCNVDAEGVAVQRRTLVHNGILEGYILSTYTAKRLKMKTTGNAGGIHNVIVKSGENNLSQLIAAMPRGLYITELMGQGVNLVTGDYSRGAAGFWVENGKIQYPVEGITIAGNLHHMLKQIVEIGTDRESRGSIQTGSILIENMSVAGAASI